MTCRPVRKILISGPDNWNIEENYQKFKQLFEDEVGQEPNILCFGNHNDWVLRRIYVMGIWLKKYAVIQWGDLVDCYIKSLENEGFKTIEAKEVYLE